MIRPPLRLTLAGCRWTVREAPRATVEAAYHDGGGCPKGAAGCVDGWTDRIGRTIWLCDDLAPDAALETLCHEWAHVELPEARHKRVYRIGTQLSELIRWHGWERAP